jgi:hypothetical protein
MQEEEEEKEEEKELYRTSFLEEQDTKGPESHTKN